MTCDGGCLCGAVRWRAGADPIWVGHCHCSMCRRASGAAAASWAAFAAPAFRFTRGTPKTYASSGKATRQFCADCGGQLIFQFNKDADKFIAVSVGSFDAPDRIAPIEHVWRGDRISWLHLDEHLPARPMPDAT